MALPYARLCIRLLNFSGSCSDCRHDHATALAQQANDTSMQAGTLLSNDMLTTLLQSCAAHHALQPLIDHSAPADMSPRGVDSMPCSRLQLAGWRQTRPVMKEGTKYQKHCQTSKEASCTALLSNAKVKSWSTVTPVPT